MSIFILFFFLSLDLVKSMAGERVGVNDVTRGRILACYKSVCVCVCVFRGDTSFCVLSVTVPDWLPCFLFPVSTRTGYIWPQTSGEY